MTESAWRILAAAVLLVLATGCTRTPEQSMADRVLPADSVELTYGTEYSQYGILSTPARTADSRKHPVVILVHGGFWSERWDQTLMTPLAEDLVERGYATWNIEFRRVGGYGGWPETFDDVSAAIDHLAVVADEYQLDLQQTVLVGHSSGGHLALWALGRDDVAVVPTGVVGLAAVTELARFSASTGLLGGTIESVPDRYEQAAPLLDPDLVRLVHGDSDSIVPLESLELARLAEVPIAVVENTDHFDVIEPSSAAWQVAVDQIKQLLDQ